MATKDIGNLRTRLSWEDDGANRSLEGFKRDLRGLRSEMNAAKSGGREYTNSLKGMRQQSDILTRRFKTQEKQVEELRNRYKQLTAAGKADTVAARELSSQINNTTAQMNRTENQLQNLNREIQRMESPWTQLGDRMTTVGTTMQDVGRGMANFGRDYSMNVTAPIVAGGAAVFKAAMDFETAFAGVEKTFSGTEQQLADLRTNIRDMAKEIPASTTEIAAVAEAAGQLGIEAESIEGFTRTMIDLGEATNMTADTAATEFARFANITGMAQDDFDKLGSSVVELGNNMATTEAEISSMAQRLAAQGSQVGMTEAEIMALAASMSSLGIESEAGGSAMTRVLKRIDSAVDESGDQLEAFSDAAGTSSSEFAKAWENEPIEALDMFISGLGESGEAGENLTSILDELGISGIRESDTILRLAGSSDTLTEAVELSSDAWEENSALTEEAAQRYETTESQLKILWNRIKDVGITLGDALIPAVMDAIDAAEPLIQSIEDGAQAFSEMDESQQQTILKMIGLVAAVGPASVVLGNLTNVIGGVVKVGGSFASMLGRAGGKGLLGRIGLMGLGGGPVGIAIGGITALGSIFLATRDSGQELHDINLDVAQSLSDTHTEVSEAAQRYDELRNKANLTTEEFGELLDIRKEMSENPEQAALEELETRYEELADKSGLTKDQLAELIEHNQTIVDNAPHTAEAHSQQGEAIAGTNDELQGYLDNLRQTALEEIELEKMKWAENRVVHQENLNEAKERERELDEQIMMLGDFQNMSKEQLEERYWEVVDAQANYLTSEEEAVRLAQEEEVLQGLLNDGLVGTIENLQSQKEEQAGIIENAETELEKGAEIDAVYAEILLKQVGINENGEEAITVAEEKLVKLREEKEELQKVLEAEGDINGQTSEQIANKQAKITELENILAKLGEETELNSGLIEGEQKRENAIRHVNDVLSAQAGQLDTNNNKIDAGTQKAGEMSKEAGRDVTKEVSAVGWLLDDAEVLTNEAQRQVTKTIIGSGWLLPMAQDLTAEAGKDATKIISANVSPSIGYINEQLGSTVSKTVQIRQQLLTNSASTLLGYADGTDNHKGGPFVAGEEGWELGRMGNRWEMLNFGMYDRPRGYEVFPHDESKKILRALNNMPGYASGARPSGEADRLVGQMNSYSQEQNNQAILQQNYILMDILQSSRNIEKKPVLTEGDIGNAAGRHDARRFNKHSIFSGRSPV